MAQIRKQEKRMREKRRKKQAKIILLSICVMVALGMGIIGYDQYIREEISKESSEHLLATYEQVNRTFTLFAERNWNALYDWDNELQKLADSGEITYNWKEYAKRKSDWAYSDFYLFNENNNFVTAAERKGTADSIRNVFPGMYETEKPIVSSYIASSGKRKVVFAIPMSEPIEMDGVTYTGLAVSYDNDKLSSNIVGDIYKGKSDCYILKPDGTILFSVESKTEVKTYMHNMIQALNDANAFRGDSGEIFQKEISDGKSGSVFCTYNNQQYYLVYQPVGIEDWSIVGMVQQSVVDAGMRKVQNITCLIFAIFACGVSLFLAIIAGNEVRKKFQRKEVEKRELEYKKQLADELFSGIGQIVDRFSVCNLKTNRYEYHEHVLDHMIYPETGNYQMMVETVSRKYVCMTETENAKIGQLLAPEYLNRVLRKKGDILKFEYRERNQDVYKIMNIVPIEWDEDGNLVRFLLIAQDNGQQVKMKNIANTDGLTGLFNERYFSSILRIKEQKKHPFVLFYLDLDRFKPVNDTYGHDMGDKLLKGVAMRLYDCVREKDYAFRIGGDEFAIIVSANMDEEQCQKMKERIITAVCRPFLIDGTELSVGCSCGYAVYPMEDNSTAEIRILADQRMYEEKAKNHAMEKEHNIRNEKSDISSRESQDRRYRF